MNNEHEAAPWDVVVVGLGGVGSFALRSLTHSTCSGLTKKAAKKRILGLERFRVGHANGSSHGETRVFRHAYFEHPDYVPLLRYSTDDFLRLEAESGEGGEERVHILEQCGCLIIERRRPALAALGDERKTEETESEKVETCTPLIDACIRSAKQHSIPIELIEHDELVERFPQFDFHPMHVGLHEQGGGFVRPEMAVIAAVEVAKRRGAVVREGVRVCSIEERRLDSNKEGDLDGWVACIKLLSDEGKDEEILTRRVVVAGGPWAGHLIPSWSRYLTVTRQIQAWINVESKGNKNQAFSSRIHGPENMPTWIRAPEPGDSLPPLYGFPTDPQSAYPHRIKLALHGRKDFVTDPDKIAARRVHVTESDLEELVSSSVPFVRVANALMSSSETVHPFVDAKTCLYTVSPDEHFLLGQPDGYQCTYAAAGLSGHGFKMAPALGKVLADLALTGETDMPISFLSPKRFAT